MELGAILLLITLLVGVGIYLAAPLVGGRSRHLPEETRGMSSLLAERERLINALQELDFDFKLGKIPEEDYPTQRAELLQKGAGILRKLDSLTPAPPSQLGRGAARKPPAAKSRLGQERARTVPLSDDEIESMLAARRKGRSAESAGFCPRCGKPVLSTDQFCSNCGKALR